MAERKEVKVAGWHARAPKAVKCQCRHPFQDRAYGLGLRLHAATKAGWRCTVCSTEKFA